MWKIQIVLSTLQKILQGSFHIVETILSDLTLFNLAGEANIFHFNQSTKNF